MKKTKARLKELKKAISTAEKMVWNSQENNDFTRLDDLNKIHFLARLIRMLKEYSLIVNIPMDVYLVRHCDNLIRILRRNLLKRGIILRKVESKDEYIVVDDIWKNLRGRPIGQKNLNRKMANAIMGSGMNIRQIAEASGTNHNVICGYLHGRICPLNSHGEWFDCVRRFSAFLGFSPEDLFPKSLWEASRRRAYTEYAGGLAGQESNHHLPSDPIIKREYQSAFRALLRPLSQRCHLVICARYGLFGSKPRTYQELSKILGVTKERVRQLEKQSMRRLRQADWHAEKLKAFLRQDSTTLVDIVSDRRRTQKPGLL